MSSALGEPPASGVNGPASASPAAPRRAASASPPTTTPTTVGTSGALWRARSIRLLPLHPGRPHAGRSACFPRAPGNRRSPSRRLPTHMRETDRCMGGTLGEFGRREARPGGASPRVPSAAAKQRTPQGRTAVIALCQQCVHADEPDAGGDVENAQPSQAALCPSRLARRVVRRLRAPLYRDRPLGGLPSEARALDPAGDAGGERGQRQPVLGHRQVALLLR